MLERVIENWLNSANERSFQRPFCYILASEGYTVLHLSRHCGMELGKDILAVDPQGRLCAFQLKSAPSGRIALREWRNDIEPQILSLVGTKIVHPSAPKHRSHRSILVVNGDLDEEVQHAIDGYNRGWEEAGHRGWKLEVIVRGQILAKAKQLQTNLWPTDLREMRDILELYLRDGRGPLPKDVLARTFETVLGLAQASGTLQLSKRHFRRAFASAAVLCAIALSNFTTHHNYSAEIDAWAMYLAYVLAVAERHRLSPNLYGPDLALGLKIIENLLAGLSEEVQQRTHFFEPSFLADHAVYKARMTRLLGLMATYGILRRSQGREPDRTDDFLRAFCRSTQPEIWGEAAVPEILAAYWYRR